MEKKCLIWVVGITALLALIGVSGCGTIHQKKASAEESSAIGKPIGISSALKFEDVPVPAGFKILDSDSFTFQNEGLRIGLLKYTGSTNPSKVVAFYKEQMPLYNWELINIIEYGRRMLNFERSGQSCIVIVEPSKFKTVLTIAVAPKATRPMKEEEEIIYKQK